MVKRRRLAFAPVLRPMWAAAAIAVAVFSARTLDAQILDRAVVLENARVHTGTRVLPKATVVIKGGKIVALGRSPKLPLMKRTIDLEGKVITPGFIDCASSLGFTGSAPRSEATSKAEDGFDRYARRDLQDALRQGVTAIYLRPGDAAGLAGTGAVIRLAPDGDAFGEVVASRNALAINMPSAASPVQRARGFAQVHGEFRKALDYRNALDQYEQDLEEYLEKLEEYAKKKKKEKSDEGGDAEKKKEGDAGDAEAGAGKGSPGKKRRRRRGSMAEAGVAAGDSLSTPSGRPEAEIVDDTQVPPRPRRRRRPGGRGGPPSGGPQKASEEKKDDDAPKKPREPEPRPDLDLLLQALDSELPVRVEVHRSNDILNVLDLAEEFAIDLIIEGGTEAYLHADRLAELDVRVVLGRQVHPEAPVSSTTYRQVPDLGARLRAAGVEVYVGSGGRAKDARFVHANAQLARALGAIDDPLRAVTRDAAELLGVEGIGRIERNGLADLVVWSASPGDPESRVEQVYVDGELVYSAEGESR